MNQALINKNNITPTQSLNVNHTTNTNTKPKTNLINNDNNQKKA